MERAVPVIDACSYKVGKNIVCVRRTDELVDRYTHMLCIVSCKYVSEVACRNDNIDLVAESYLAVLDELSIGRYIVDYLRCKSAPVDGIGR